MLPGSANARRGAGWMMPRSLSSSALSPRARKARLARVEPWTLGQDGFAAAGIPVAFGRGLGGGGHGRGADVAAQRQADHALVGACRRRARRSRAAGPRGCAALRPAARRSRRVADALAVDEDQRLVALVAELDLDLAEQLVDGADAVAGDAFLIELRSGWMSRNKGAVTTIERF